MAGRQARPLLGYIAVWLLSVAVFWIAADSADAMGCSLVFIWVLNPSAIFSASFLIGGKRARVGRAWVAPIAFGAAYMLLPYATFGLANMLSAGGLHAPDPGMMVLGAAVSAAGLFLGGLARATLRRRRAGRRR